MHVKIVPAHRDIHILEIPRTLTRFMSGQQKSASVNKDKVLCPVIRFIFFKATTQIHDDVLNSTES